MSKRRKKKNDLIDSLILLMVLFIKSIVIILYRIIIFTYDLVTFYSSGYKIKSGNSFIKAYFDKGFYGEFVLYRKVCRIFGKASVLTNLYLDSKNTEKTEIDVLAVSNQGIYVYEMKNYSGYIYGSEKDQYWTQVLNKWSKNKFYNPLKQNYAHTKAVENYLGVSKEQIVPIVVFSDSSKLSKISINEDQNVYQYSDALRFVRKNEKKKESLISSDDKTDYLIRLLERSNMSKEVKTKHIEEVKLLQEKKRN